MNKKLLLLFNYLLFVIVLQAAPVDRTEAKKKALEFLAGKQAAARGTSLNLSALSLVMEETSSYYIFNVSTHDGFVIVSGDDRTPEILGYSDSGSFDAKNMPPNMKAWLQGYANQIKVIPEIANTRQIGVPKRERKEAITPLLQTIWNQDEPYNNLCPNDGNGTCVTGCVATAMAQIMNYYNWPLGATTEIPAYTAGISREALPPTVFDWDNMLNSYSGSEASAAKTAIATLMKYCGWGAQMNYGTNSSGAYERNAESALKNYFGYDQNVRRVIRDNYSINEWDDIIYNEILSGRPVMYSGQSSSGSGHEFVCDGVDAEGLYHINWGWGGKGNGYFVLSVLNPTSNGIGGTSSHDGYSMDQSAIIGIQKPKNQQLEEEKKLTVLELRVRNNTLIYNRNSLNDNFTGVQLCAVVANATISTFDASFGFALYDQNDVQQQVWYSAHGEIHPNYYFGKNGQTYTIYSLSDFGANKTGHFTIVPVSKEHSSSTWLKDGASDRYYIDVEMTETQLTLTVKPIVDLSITKVEYTGNKMANVLQDVEVTVVNNGSEYNGNLYLNVNGNYVSGDGIAIASNSTQIITFHYVPSAGTNNYKIGFNTNGDSPLIEGSVEIEPYTYTDNIDLDLSMTVNNPIEGTKLFGNKLKVTISATNNSSSVYYGRVGLKLGSVYHFFQNVTILAGKTATYNINCDLNIGTNYTLTPCQYKNNCWIDVGSPINFTAAEAVTITNADGTTEVVEATTKYVVPDNATFIDLQNQSTITEIDASKASGNCLYLMAKGANTPSGLGTANVIKGTEAEQITLVDGADFVPPMDFTTSQITYTRTFNIAADQDKGWTTIVLPFEVKKVTVGDKEIDWFHSDSDTGKNFWVKELVSDGDGSIAFNYTEKIEAYKPYIIAVPDNRWGEEWNLIDKPITFVGHEDNTTILIYSNKSSKTTCKYFQFIGTLRSRSLTNVYILNSEGSIFTNGNGTVEPFRAYFRSLIADSPGDILGVRSIDEQLTPISSITISSSEKQGVYSLDGRKVGNTMKNVSRGVYIVNGKKVIK